METCILNSSSLTQLQRGIHEVLTSFAKYLQDLLFKMCEFVMRLPLLLWAMLK